MGKLGDLFKKSNSINIGNPQAMHWGMGHYDRKEVDKFAALNKGSKKSMTAAQRADYLARQEAKGTGYIRTPLTSRYS